MDLFETSGNACILPFDGIINYFGKVMDQYTAGHYFERLLTTIEWKNDEAFIYGRHIITKRKAAWYGNERYLYTYSGVTRQALAWTKELLELRTIAEKVTGSNFNSCLLNLYHDGDEGMTWHSDDEKTLVPDMAIASFSFKHKKTKLAVSVNLENCSLLVMEGATQSNWLHCVPKSKKVHLPRINLTFRKMAG
jgi:alkylated DNA repair dioxygenase AlkB